MQWAEIIYSYFELSWYTRGKAEILGQGLKMIHHENGWQHFGNCVHITIDAAQTLASF